MAIGSQECADNAFTSRSRTVTMHRHIWASGSARAASEAVTGGEDPHGADTETGLA